MTKIERGDIYYIERSPSCRETGSEQYSGRPDEITEVDELRAEVAELTKDLVFYRRAYYELIDKLLAGGDEE